MVFVSAVEAKPMVPHKDGRSCLGCEATLASQWRGPGSNYCSLSQCKKAAGAAREQMRNTSGAPLEETVTALQTEVHELEEQIGTLDRKVEEQQKRLAEQDTAFAAMQRQVAYLSLAQSAMQQRDACESSRMQSMQAGKRPALSSLPPRLNLPR